MKNPVSRMRLASQSMVLLALSFMLTSCSVQTERVGVMLSPDDSFEKKLPVAVITWCGDHAPAQLGVSGDVFELLYTSDSEPEGTVLEVDLAAPGHGWTVDVTLSDGEKWTVEDGNGHIPTPSRDYLSTLAVSTDQAEDNEVDLGSTTFTISRLSRNAGKVYESSPEEHPEYEVTPREEFTPNC